jgi:methionine-S-sulfoxide reductase
VRTRVGYTGGTKRYPTYTNLGDHSEALQIDYDPVRISYKNLLDLFWSNHDPTIQSWSRQYRSAIFYHNDAQKKLSLETSTHLQATLTSEIMTDITPFTEFYLAEDYHQKHALQHSYEYVQEFKAMYSSFNDIISSTAAARVNGYLGGYGTLKNLQAELDSYGLSVKAKEHLFDFVKASTRYQCKRPGVCSI